MVVGVVGIGKGSISLLNSIGSSVDVVEPIGVVPPFHIKVDVTIPKEQRIYPDTKRPVDDAINKLFTMVSEMELDAVVLCVDLTPPLKQRKFQRSCSIGFLDLLRDNFPDVMVHTLPILPDARDGEYKDDVVETTSMLQNKADGVVLYDTGMWTERPQRNDEHQEIARRLRELYAYAARDGDSLRDVSWVAANGGMAIGYEEGSVSLERNFLRRTPVLEDDISSLIRRAGYGRLTAPVDVSNSNRGLVVIRTPPDSVELDVLQDAIDTFIAETSVPTFRVGIQEDNDCDNVHTLVALSGSGVGYEAAAIAKQVRELAESTPTQ